MNQCKFCKSQTKNKFFCNKYCSAKWLRTPEAREKFYTQSRSRKIQVSRKKTFEENPEIYEAMIVKQSNTMHRYMNSLTEPQRKARRIKMSRIMKEAGHKPVIRGGNGTGPTKAEMVLIDAFYPHAKNNFVVKTGKRAGSGYPCHYKVDVAFPEIMMAVEADGRSHLLHGRKERDAKKTNLLTALGWTVLRFTNKRILEDTQNVKEELRSIILRLKATPATA